MAADREILTVREFDAPRERVFEAWTDAAKLARWWGPNGFTNVFETHEPAAGGAWRFTMRGPDGTEYPNESRYVEVTPPERLVLDHLSGHRYRATVLFEALSWGRTRLTWSMVFEDSAEFARVADFIRGANEENLDRLETVLNSRFG